ncbi:aminoglycoside/hydroxyurea antibiotic resistance kinase [Kribbella sp. VKM Ac-2527]|uniref:Aminoglycoside/hydroxyurea antibiotic resistance kinase n=1 Tax=Kribbella caucasensis TaxID=2512215 RepID=A0A4R6KTV9_9ACTN|nr:aminoglycoside phosphotransferase family protein [Kribbella sp. VKM Ac-2527]TDO54978.1 aminoglycoside/hydroxyurea antibiotic resistance kinase [Kribbella sp. VKM Ac-2527]
MSELVIPLTLWELHGDDEDARQWLESLPDLTTTYLNRWSLEVVGTPLNGAASLVLPVRRADGTAAMLKLQQLNDETEGEALGLRTWNGDGAVRVLADDPTRTESIRSSSRSRLPA